MKKLTTNNYQLRINRNRGFVLLFTVLIASVILLIAMGITSISYRETILSTEANDGTVAFFAADTGIECALYADKKIPDAFSLVDRTPFSCAGGTIEVLFDLSVFSFEFSTENNKCVYVSVDKSSPQTIIESLGYSVPCEQKFGPRAVTRAIRISY